LNQLIDISAHFFDSDRNHPTAFGFLPPISRSPIAYSQLFPFAVRKRMGDTGDAVARFSSLRWDEGPNVEIQVTEGWWQGVVQQFHARTAA